MAITSYGNWALGAREGVCTTWNYAYSLSKSHVPEAHYVCVL